MTTTIETSPFEVLRSYDAPELLFSQVFDDELTFAGIRNTLFDPQRLSPNERSGISARLKKAAGNNSVSDALIDIATNPLIWFMFVTSPAAVKSVGLGAKGVFSLASKFAADVRENSPILQQIGLTAPIQALADTPGLSALMQLSRHLPENAERFTAALGEQMNHVFAEAKRRGLRGVARKGLVLERYRTGTPEREFVERVRYALSSSLAGMDKEFTNVTAQLVDGEVKAVGTNFRRRVTANLDNELRSLGALGLRDEAQKQMMITTLNLYGKDLPAKVIARSTADELRGLMEVDVEKVRRLASGMRLLHQGADVKGPLEGIFGGLQGNDMVAKILGADLEALASSGGEGALAKLSGKSASELEDLIVKLFVTPIKENKIYFPRNVRDFVGSPLGRREIGAFEAGHTFITTGAVRPRLKGKAFDYHPDDLTRIGQLFGAEEALIDDLYKTVGNVGVTEAGFGLSAAQIAKPIAGTIAAAREIGEVIPVFRLDYVRGMDRFIKSTSETLEMFVRPVSLQVKASLSDQTARLGGLVGKKNATHPETLAALRWGNAQRRFGDNPLFNFHEPRTVAEVLARDSNLIADEGALNLMKDVWVPRITGHLTRSNAGQIAIMQQAKAGMDSFANSAAGKAITKSGKRGAQFISQMKHFADPTLQNAGQASSTIEGALTKWLYVTHLGMNLSSAMLNLMQPMLHAATGLGAQNVIKGYGQAFKELGSYLDTRLRGGVKLLSDAESAKLIDKSFKYAELTGIKRDLPQLVDQLTFQPGGVGVAGRKEGIFDLMMKFFEKAEWINRNTTAYAVENLYKSKGLFREVPKAGKTLSAADDLLVGRRLNDTEQAVLQFQFGGSLINQPTLFMKGWLSNGLFRQFLTFPLRSFTASVSTLPTLAGEANYFKGLGRTWMRGLGISAVGYELGKNLAGADPSRGLFLSASTDIFGGERLVQDGNEWIPVPPVISIPIDMARGMATNDVELLRRTIPRTIPGGVAMARMIGMAPLHPGVLGDLHKAAFKTYTDWGNPQADGTVAVRKADGSILGFEKPAVIIMKSLGVDLGAFGSEQELTQTLLKNREEIVGARHAMLQKLLANDVGGAMKVRAEFEKRFGMPLTISKQQLKSAFQKRQRGRAERILDTLPPEGREAYLRLAASAPVSGLSNLPEEALRSSTAAEREAIIGRRDPGVRLDPQTIEELKRLVAESKELKRAREGKILKQENSTFQSFQPF